MDIALPAYTQQRLPDVQAIMTINEVVASSEGVYTDTASTSIEQLMFDLSWAQ
ncbi:hypothetical protein ABBQ32_004046 [Trebouxia sp. C0010 RCD-2024]